MTKLSILMHIQVGAQGICSVKVENTNNSRVEWCIQGDDQWNKEINAWMKTYAAGRQPEEGLMVDLSAQPFFTQCILDEMQRIPFGQTLSYAGLARAVGKPKAARAVGNACGRNPIPIIVPCHRVISSDGSIGGFSLDPSLKKNLLAFENVLGMEKAL
ncbi:MAG: MGMT family protein [Chlamydiales bacterium]|nr:MGMT family protein [Chlamydiales bacterium]